MMLTSECWEALSPELVQKSFHACVISVNMNGTEDEHIHCLKEGRVAANAREEIRKETATLRTAELDKSDPFADVEDEDEAERTCFWRLSVDYSLRVLCLYCITIMYDAAHELLTCYSNTSRGYYSRAAIPP